MARQIIKSRSKAKKPRKDYSASARALGVTTSHLRRVAIGERISRSLTRRYRDLKRQQRQTAAANTNPSNS